MTEDRLLRSVAAVLPATRRVDSLGAGVQSTAMYLLACEGRRPRPEIAVFADTQGEPQYVYDHLERLIDYGRAHGGPPIKIVTAGDLRADTLSKASVSPPLWVRRPDGKPGGPGFRGCTDRYKTRPINAFLRQWAQVPRGCTTPVVQLNLGISTDEALRQKRSREPWLVYRHPLLDLPGLQWSRQQCEAYLRQRGFDSTPKSACVYCPFHTDELWSEVRALDPDGWQAAVALDRQVRHGTRGRDEGGATFFLHRSLLPLDQVALPTYQPGATATAIGCSPHSCPGDEIALIDDPTSTRRRTG